MKSRAVFIGATVAIMSSVAYWFYYVVCDGYSVNLEHTVYTHDEHKRIKLFTDAIFNIKSEDIYSLLYRVLLLLALYFVAYISFLYAANPEFRMPAPIRRVPGRGFRFSGFSSLADLMLLSVIPLIAWQKMLAQTFVPVELIDCSLCIDLYPNYKPPASLVMLGNAAIVAAAWVVIGLMDKSRRARTPGAIGQSAMLGMCAGFGIYMNYFMVKFGHSAIDKYLDATYPFGYYAISWQMYLYVLAISLLSGLSIAYALLGFAPSERSIGSRAKDIALACFIAVITLGVIYSTQRQTDSITARYSRPLVEIAGLDSSAPAGWRALVMSKPEATVAEWPLELKYYNPYAAEGYRRDERIPISPKNLMAIEGYYQEYSINLPYFMRRNLRSLSVYGHMLLLDPGEALDKIIKYSEVDYIYSDMMKNIPDRLPLSERNKATYLKFTRNQNWEINKASVREFHSGLKLMGMEDESAKWAEKAESTGAFLKNGDEKLVHGSVKGRLKTDHLDASNIYMVLSTSNTLFYAGVFDQYQLKYIIAVERPSAEGNFKFDGLKSAEFTNRYPVNHSNYFQVNHPGYYLFLVDKSGKLPIEPGAIKVENMPGVITINSTTPDIDLGTIRISAAKR